MATTIAELQARITADTSGFKQGMQEAQGGLKGFGSGIVGAAKGALDFGLKLGGTIFAVKSLADGAIGLGSALLGPVASLEQNKIAFTGLLGSAQKADAFLRDMQSFAASTPFEFPELVTASQHMLAFGFQASQIKPLLTSIGNAMAAMGQSGESVDQVVRILGQMHAATKVNAGDMMQLTSMGIPAWDMLAKGMGKTVPQLQDMVSKGLVPADKAIGILQTSFDKSFGGSMQKQSESFNGLLSTFHDNINLAMTAFAGPAFERAKGALTQLGAAVQSPAFQQFAQTLGVAVGNALDLVAGAVKAVVPSIMAFAQFLQQNEGAMNAFKVALVAAAVVIGVVMVASFVAWTIAAGAAAIATIAATWPVLAVIAAIALLVIGIKLLVEHWSQITAFLQGVWAKVVLGVQIGLQVLGHWFNNLGTTIHNALMGAIAAIVSWVLGVIAKFQEAKAQADAKIAEMVAAVIGRIRGAVGGVIAAALAIKDAILNTIGGLKDRLLGLIGDAINALINAIKNAAGRVGSAFSSLFSGIHIPGFAEGGVTPGGLVMVGERGPEIVALPSGSRVYPHGTGPAGSSVPGGGGGGNTYVTNVYPQQAVLDTAELARIQRRQDLLRGMY